ncbi:hypothetical protein CBB_A0017 [Clostridium botulinum Bf]|nr:hypothetical protein CBB_A0017 [Clostridium botulinum Bf]
MFNLYLFFNIIYGKIFIICKISNQFLVYYNIIYHYILTIILT